ncbi:MAG TPA: DUF2799 domain-containing protein [Burkholderiales bacterium]|nr:DUF2799 domain-containing protein [Burkholderiales bacterium]
MRRYYSACLVVLLSACASVSESDCRTSNWYARGEQDGLRGDRSLIDTYVEQCRRFGATPDGQQYHAGWAAGYAEWNRRVSRGRS